MTDIKLLESLRRKIKPRVLEWKTHAPFDGCFWQYSYALVASRGEDMQPIAITEQDKALFPTLHATIDAAYDDWRFGDFAVYAIDKNLYNNVPPRYWQLLWDVLNEYDLSFTWPCKHCGTTTNRPTEPTDEHGAGGIVIVNDNWYCDECDSALRCSYCGEITDPGEAWWDYSDELMNLYDRGLCPSCRCER